MATPNNAPGASTQAVVDCTKKVVEALIKRGGKSDCLVIFADLTHKARTLTSRDRSGFEKLASQWRSNLREHGLEPVCAQIDTLTKQRQALVTEADIEEIISRQNTLRPVTTVTEAPRVETPKNGTHKPVLRETVNPIEDFAKQRPTPAPSLAAAVAGLKPAPVSTKPPVTTQEGAFQSKLSSLFEGIFMASAGRDPFRTGFPEGDARNFPIGQFITTVEDPNGKTCLVVETVKGHSKILGQQISLGVVTLKTHLDSKNRLIRFYKDRDAQDRSFKRHLRAIDTFPGLGFRLYVQNLEAKRNIPEYNSYLEWDGKNLFKIDGARFEELCAEAGDLGQENGLRK